jgi:hypothetical protein
MHHLMDILINVLVIALAILAYNWLAINPSSPLVGKL